MVLCMIIDILCNIYGCYNKAFKILIKNDGKALSVLRNVIRSNPTMVFDEEANKLSFQVFKKYIFHNNADMNSYANRLLVNVILDDESVKWLIDNYDESEHIMNRILRYPTYNERIANWAKQQYKHNTLPKRNSELIGLLIHKELPQFVISDNKVKIWGIYYSKVSDDIKKQLLFAAYSVEVLNDFISICKRLGYFDLIEEILRVNVNKV